MLGAAYHVAGVVVRAVECCIEVVVGRAAILEGAGDGELRVRAHQRSIGATSHDGVAVAVLDGYLLIYKNQEVCNMHY